MVGTCALNDMNAIMKSLGIFILIILLSIVVIYFMYCSQSKHSEILENFTGNEATLTYHNYGSEHTGPYADGDKKTITGDVTLRDCQVYFVGEDQQGDCDEEYKTNPNTTCKYVFKDDWKEIANIKVGENTNYYPNKIYNQNYTKTDINNHHLTAQCVKKFESEIDKRYIYKNNDLINYNHDGSNEGNTLELNYRNNESDKYMKGDFISMTFGIDRIAGDNYTNVIDSICSKRYNDHPNLKVGDIFYKFKLNDSNQITSVKYAKVKDGQKSFEIVDIDLNEFADSKSTNFSYNEETNSINVIKGAEVNPENVTIYKFEYDYLCGDNYAGIIKGFTTSDFTMNKNYVNSVGMTPIIKTIGPKGSDKIIIPERLKEIFKVTNLNTDGIISSLSNKGEELITITNVDPTIEKGKLSRLIDAYNEKIKEAEDNSETFGVNKSADYIFNYNFQKIIEGNFDKIVENDKGNIKSIADKKKVPYTFGFTKGYNKYIADVKFSDKLIETSVKPVLVGSNKTYIFKLKPEEGKGLVYDFTNKNSVSSWKNYATSIGGTTNLNNYYANEDGVFYSGPPVGYFQLKLPTNYDSVEITFNNPFYNFVNLRIDTLANITNSTPKLTLLKGESDTRIWYYNTGDYLRIDETNTGIIGGNLKLTFKKTQTEFNFTINENTKCDILIVGGGGAGGNSMGGGGGAGGVVYTINQTLNAGTYTIGVGKGGLGLSLAHSKGQGTIGADQDGKDSFIKDSNGNYVSLNMGGINQNLMAYGGGGGGIYYNPAYVNGRNGGSGGGSSESNNNKFVVNTAGSALQGNTYWNGSTYVAGGKSGRQNTTEYQDYNAGGGGGAGSNGNVYKDGNNGVSINITGTQQYYAAGGGGGQYSINYSTNEGIGGSGIGGNGRIYNGSSYLRNATSGLNGTGSGGGGGSYTQDPDNPAGSGGSGIVIIKIIQNTDEGNVIPVRNRVEAIKYFDSRKVEVGRQLYAEPFTNGHLTSLEKQEKIACKIGGYIFLESNTYFDTTFILNYNGFVYNYSLLKIEKINSDGSKTVVKNINPDDIDKTFSISTSGFYIYEITVVMFSKNIILTDIDFSLHCKKGSSRTPINLKDYLYKGRVYPVDSDTHTTDVSTNIKIEKFNRSISNILMTNNTVESLREFKTNLLNNDLNDFFNISFWKSCHSKAAAKKNAIFILKEGCIPHGGNSMYRENCTLLNNIEKLKSQILRYTSITEINKLFKDTEFTAPGFNTNINITDEFKSDSHNINNFITYEKKNNYLNRTQQSINDNFFRFTENSEKSIYVKRLPDKDLIL